METIIHFYKNTDGDFEAELPGLDYDGRDYTIFVATIIRTIAESFEVPMWNVTEEVVRIAKQMEQEGELK